MTVETHSQAVFHSNEERPARGWFIALGILSVIAGTAAIIFPYAASIAAEIAFGAMILVLGLAQIFTATRVEGWKGTTLMVVAGLLGISAGVLLLSYPMLGVLTVTLVLGSFLLSAGVIRSILAFRLKPNDGWGYLLAGGIAAIILGFLVLSGLPGSALWFLGLLLGVDLIGNGVWMLLVAAEGDAKN